MTKALSLLCRVIARRIAAGEMLEDVLVDYPRLSEQQAAEIRTYFQA